MHMVQPDVCGKLAGVPKGNSSIGRALVSKTSGWGFESLLPCYAHLFHGAWHPYVEKQHNEQYKQWAGPAHDNTTGFR